MAFSIIPTQPGATFRYQQESTYFVGRSEWKTEVSNDVWLRQLPRGGTLRFTATVNLLWAPRANLTGGRGWIFQRANRDLEGSFEITTYYACGFREPCGGQTGVGPDIDFLTTGVGAVFGLKYHPVGSDPTPENNNLHWIQVVSSNRTRLSFVDNGKNFEDPYYDTGVSVAGKDFFSDRPYFFSRSSPVTSNFFTADLYLVEEVASPKASVRQVIVYNGIQWGWRSNQLQR
ncbi:MAG: hypothetical protein EBE86_002980 [Hormoscilla sp. GUM202]|nr:hypothetical protein [Hormoscilla sp. GUM202]